MSTRESVRAVGLRSLGIAALLLAVLAGIASGAGIAGIAAVGSGSPPSAAEAHRLAAGEVLVEVAEPAGGGPGEGMGRGVIDAPPERVFAALSDFAHYQEWMPFVTRSDSRAEALGAVVSSQALHLPALIGDRRYQIRAVSTVFGTATGGSGRSWSWQWAYVPGSGNVVDTRGSWTVVEMGGGVGGSGGIAGIAGRRSLVTCRMFLDPGGVSGWTMNRAMKKNLLWVFEGLRQQVLRGRYLKY